MYVILTNYLKIICVIAKKLTATEDNPIAHYKEE